MAVIREAQLVDGIAPIRGFVLATAIHHLFESGVYDALRAQPGRTATELAAQLGYHPVRLTALLTFLSYEGYLALTDQHATLTPAGNALDQVRPWYQMLIGGYGETFLQVGQRLRVDSGPAGRDGGQVALGSCGISMHDSLPLLRRLLAQYGRDYRMLLDLGCGSGVYLTELAMQYPNLHAMGIEPAQPAVDAALAWVAKSPAADRIEVRRADAVPFLQADEVKPDLVLLCFVIHEILGQRGEDGVRDLLQALVTNHPEADLVVIDVDHRWTEPAVMAHPLARAYYNTYYLLHPFTEQRLESAEFWEAMFAGCGLSVIAQATTDPSMDSTGLEIGWLLRRAG